MRCVGFIVPSGFRFEVLCVGPAEFRVINYTSCRTQVFIGLGMCDLGVRFQVYKA